MTLGDKWKHVIFSDEKTFNIDGQDGLKYYWHNLGKNFCYFSKILRGGKSLILWLAFVFGGKFNLQVV